MTASLPSEEPTFDPEVWQTWPFARCNIVGRKLDGSPRLDSYGEGWCDGFDLALRMADRFHATGEWVVPDRPSDLLGGPQLPCTTSTPEGSAS